MYHHIEQHDRSRESNTDMVCIDVLEFGKVPYRIGQAIAHFCSSQYNS